MGVSLVVIVLSVFSVVTLKTNPDYTYEDYCRQFSKQYQPSRIQIFNQNYQQFMDLVLSGVDLMIGPFLDLTPQQLQQSFGFKPANLGIPLSSPSQLSFELFSPPSRFDWRQKDRVTQIKHQGFCGACWAFSSTAQYESLIAIESNGKKFDLSQQYGTQCQNQMSSGCNGGYPYKALQIFAQSGIPSQKDYSYQQNSNYYPLRQICNNQSKNLIKLNNPVQGVFHYQFLSSDQILQEYLVKYGPVSVAVSANNQQFLYAPPSGLISCPNNRGVDHAVLLVGYNQTHWFIKNSWGVDWGHNGFGYINKNSSHDCKIRQWVDVMKVNFDASLINVEKQKQQIVITMSDSGNDGWNNNIVGLRQGKQILATFGKAFTQGPSSQVRLSVYSNSNQEIQVIMIQGGLRRQQISFSIFNSKGNLLLTHQNGSKFDLQIIFGRFCLSSNCKISDNVTYYLTMSDQKGDTWNGNVFTFKQKELNQNFSLNQPQFQQKQFTFTKYEKVDILVEKLGLKVKETAFMLRNERGQIVVEKKLGTPVYANQILDSFSPQSKNNNPVPSVIYKEQDQQIVENSEQIVENSEQIYKILTIVFASLLGVSLFTLISVVVYVIKLKKGKKEAKQSNNTIQTGINLMGDRSNQNKPDGGPNQMQKQDK